MTTASSRPPPLWLQEAFDTAKAEFVRGLKDPGILDLTKLATINDVYREAEIIQQKQTKSRTLRGLGRINKCLDLLRQYADVMEVFVQVKPEILALIWGPIKAIMKMASHAAGAFEKFVEVLVDIGNCLPQFERFTDLFQQNEQILKILAMFYKDILQIYHLALNFFKSRWGLVRESLWPLFSGKLKVICANITSHKELFRSQVTWEEISRAAEARKKDDLERERVQTETNRQNFRDMRIELAPRLYDEDLEHLLKTSMAKAGEWIQKRKTFEEWREKDGSCQSIWLRGIPGAGKSRLAAKVVQTLRDEGRQVAFAFLRHDNPSDNKPVRVLQSLIFQLLLENESLQPVIYQQYIVNYRKLTSSVEFLRDIVSNLTDNNEPTYLVIDGLDEVAKDESLNLLKILLHAVGATPHLKLLISCRAERHFSLLLNDQVPTIRVHEHNAADIAQYVKAETETRLERFRKRSQRQDIVSELEYSINAIAKRADGMFLYARLVLDIIMKQDTLAKALRESRNLPQGLNEAYGRVLRRFTRDAVNRPAVQKIFQWVGCAITPLSASEILQILAIEPGQRDFVDEPACFRDIEETCSPILEIRNGFVQFTHFTAKEFFFSDQSGGFVDINSAHLQALDACLLYLSFDCFVDSKESSATTTLAGNFVLFPYACHNWVDHARYISRQLLPQQRQIIFRRMNHFRNTVAKPGWNSQASASFKLEFQGWEGVDNGVTVDFLASYSHFIGRVKLGLLNYTCDELLLQDPTVLSKTFLRFRNTIESFLCKGKTHASGCACSDLIEIYGTNLFRCDRYYCKYFRLGFPTQAERDAHFQSHERPFKCEDLACIFAELGFKTSEDQERHALAVHCADDSNSGATSSDDLWGSFSQQELETISFDAIRAGEHDLLKTMLPHLSTVKDRILEFAGEYGSMAVMQVLLDAYSSTLENSIKKKSLRHVRACELALPGAIRSGDRAKITKLMELGAKGSSNATPVAAVTTFDTSLLDFLVDIGIDFEEAIYGRECIRLLAQKEKAEGVALLAELYKYVPDSKDHFESGFHYCARYGFPGGVRWFLDNLERQAWVIARLQTSSSSRKRKDLLPGRVREFIDEEWDLRPNAEYEDVHGTATYVATHNAHGGNAFPGESRSSCIQRYAQVVKMLLKEGADSHIYTGLDPGPNIEDTAGARNLERHFGAKWAKIVDKYSPGDWFEPDMFDMKYDSDSVVYETDETTDDEFTNPGSEDQSQSSSRKRHADETSENQSKKMKKYNEEVY